MNSTIYSVPDGERLYGGYAVTVDGANAPVSEVRCSAMPFNRRWPGHQRQIEQTELCGMVRFAFAGKATVSVTAGHDFTDIKVRPLSRGVTVRREGRTATFGVAKFVGPGHYSGAPAYTPNLSCSQVVNRGLTLDWAASDIDLAGTPRIFGGAVDLGCYECCYTPHGTVLSIH